MRRIPLLITLILLVALISAPAALAQGGEGEQQARIVSPALTLFTPYPAQEAAIGETISFKLTLRAAEQAQVVQLELADLPEGWTATFRGGGDVIHAAYVDPGKDATVNLQLEPPEDIQSGDYRFVVLARGDRGGEARLPLEIMVQEKLPPSLTMDIDLPTIRGSASTTFRYSVKLRNKGDEEVSVNLLAEAPPEFRVKFKSSGKEVTSLPVKANETKTISVEAKPLVDLAAGEYPFEIVAQAGEAQANLALTAEVRGEPELKLAAPDGRLSGEAYAGKQTPLKLVVQNSGSAPAYDITLSASSPKGWSVEFEPKQIPQIEAGKQVEVTANLRPSDKAVAGDYMITLRAKPDAGSTESAEFRITVLTSTWWGIAGIGLIAVAVLIVGVAVMRFGRR